MDSSLMSQAVWLAARRPGRDGGRMRAAAAMVCLSLFCGCSLMPGRKAPGPIAPPEPVLFPEAPDSLPSPPGETALPPPRHGGSETIQRAPALRDTTASATEEAQPVLPEPPPPEITIQLTDKERIQLIDETEKDVAQIAACLRSVDRDRLNEAQKRSLSDLEDLLTAVMNARDASDVQAASRLARKARLLAEDLVPK